MDWFLYDRDLRHQRVKRELTTGQRDENVKEKIHIPVPFPVLDLKAYNATASTPRMKWHELSQNQIKHGRSKY